LDGVGLLFSDRPSEDNSRVIDTLVNACPKLRRMSWFTPGDSIRYVVIIERMQGWVKWESRLRVGDGEGDVVSFNENWKGSFKI
jgi:hypothetical protein